MSKWFTLVGTLVQYVVETRKVGEARVPGRATELVGNEVNEVDERIKEAPRGDRTVVVQDVDIPASEVRHRSCPA